MFGVEFARNRKDPTARPQYPTLCEIASWMFSKKHAGCGDKQKETEKIENEMKALHQRDTAPNHGPAHDECSNNSPDQNAALCERRNAKMRENQHKHKNIIHAQRILDEIPCKKIEGVMWSFDAPDKGVKSKRYDDPDRRPTKRSAYA